jgi:ribose transport system permease protein
MTAKVGVPRTFTEAVEDVPEAEPGRSDRVRAIALNYGMVWVLIALIVAARLSYDQFLTIDNIKNLLTQNAQVGIIAAGMTLVLISGGFDLSVSGTFNLGSVLFAGLCVKSGVSVPVALAGVIGAGIVAGLINGLIVTKLRVNPFVTTLGTAAAFGGVAALYSDSQPITVDNVSGFDVLGSHQVAGIPVAIVLMVALYLIGSFVLVKTTYGRGLFATGGNNLAAELSGIRTHRVRIVAFVACAVCATLAGAVLASTLSAGQSDQAPTIALDSIAAVVIGGTSLYGGSGAMWRTAIGICILATMNNLFSSLAIGTPVQNVIKGVVVIAAVAFEAYARRTRR